jgi:hypothetical protein
MNYKLLKEIVINHFEAMEKVGKIGTRHLTEPKKYHLMNLLKKVNNFQNDIYLNHWEKNLYQLIQ